MSLPADKQRSQLLGKAIDWLMKRADLSQGHLEKLINVRLGQLVASGQITYEQARHSGTSQTSLSRICEGKIHPSREVLELIVQALKDWYASEAYQKRVQETQKEYPSFVAPQLTEEQTNDLFHLAGLATPAEIEESLARALALTQTDQDSPLAKRMEARNEAMRRKMDGHASSSQLCPPGGMHLLSVLIPLSFLPSLWHQVLAAAIGLLGLLWLYQYHLHTAVQVILIHAG